MLKHGTISVYCTILIIATVIATVPQQAAGQAATASTATPSPSPSPTPIIVPFAPAEAPANSSVRPKIIFVIGQGDPPTAGKLISALVEQLPTNYGLYFGSGNWLVPEPTWTLGDFLAQCKADPTHTQGAFVVGLDSLASITQDRFFSRTAYVDVTAHILYAQCDMNGAPSPTQVPVNGQMSRTKAGKVAKLMPTPTPTPTPTPKSAFVWFSNGLSGKGSVNTLTIVTPLALAIGIGSLAAAFIPSKSSTNTTTKTYPTTPPPGTVNTTTSMSAFNPSSENSLAAAVFTGGAAYTASQISVPTSDLQTWKAVYQAIVKAIKSMNCPLIPGMRAPSTDERYIVPASQGTAKAPFCKDWKPPSLTSP
jgi:hypothetical protein